jgi:UDP-N-acetyl-D-mannosaminuronic acid dehydrogenase
VTATHAAVSQKLSKGSEEMSFSKISVIGLGYIGLPTAALFASRKLPVVGVDVNQNAIDTINSGKIHIVEPQLDILVHATVSEGYLRATRVAEQADAFIIAVPTPFHVDEVNLKHEADLSYLQAASTTIAPLLKSGDLIILESTSPVGTTELMVDWLKGLRPDLRFPDAASNSADIFVAHCPERVLPGHAVRELVQNDRVIGGITERCAKRARELYQLVVEGNCYLTDARTAEMAKLTENAFRDANIAFANELSMICDDLGINVWRLIELANKHPRVNILQPGAGVGGHCIAVDPWFIVSASPQNAKLISTAREVNNSKPKWVLNKIISKADSIKKPRSETTIACYGITFKPDIDDLRESPALEIAHLLAQQGFAIEVVEPNIEHLPNELQSSNVQLMKLDNIVTKADIHVILVKHSHFSAAKDQFRVMNNVFDFVGLLEA